MLLGNTVEFAHMTLRLVPKILDPVDVIFLVCKEFGMVDAKMPKVRNIQHVIPSPAVRIHNTVRYNFALNDGV